VVFQPAACHAGTRGSSGISRLYTDLRPSKTTTQVPVEVARLAAVMDLMLRRADEGVDGALLAA
jgi:hypothetical protein